MSHYFWWYNLYEVKFSIRFTALSCNINIFLLRENLDTYVNFEGVVMTGILHLRLLSYWVLSISLYAEEDIYKEHDLCLQSGQSLGTHQVEFTRSAILYHWTSSCWIQLTTCLPTLLPEGRNRSSSQNTIFFFQY